MENIKVVLKAVGAFVIIGAVISLASYGFAWAIVYGPLKGSIVDRVGDVLLPSARYSQWFIGCALPVILVLLVKDLRESRFSSIYRELGDSLKNTKPELHAQACSYRVAPKNNGLRIATLRSDNRVKRLGLEQLGKFRRIATSLNNEEIKAAELEAQLTEMEALLEAAA